MTTRDNSICRYHQKYRAHKQVDGYKGNYVVKGVSFTKTISRKGNVTEPKAGHLHCGCAVDDVLMEFFFWKTWTARSRRPDFQVEESLRDEVIPARLRTFFIQAFQRATCLTLDDLYSADYGTPQYEARIRLKQAARTLQIVNLREPSPGAEEDRWGIMRNETAAGYLVQMAKMA
jgi:hypothetical protein